MKYALITGASTGIGRATAVLFGQEGYHVFLVARSADKLAETENLITANGGTATSIPTDLSQVSQVLQLVDRIKSETKMLSVICNIAGIWHGKDEVFAETNFQDFATQTVLDTYTVGLTAPSLLVHGLLPLMDKGGKIVNLSGTFQNGAKGWLPYYTSKRALEDFTVGLAEELAERNIQVNAVSPSDTATEAYAKYFPQYMDDAVEPSKIAETILTLCKEENETTGQVLVVQKDSEPFSSFHY